MHESGPEEQKLSEEPMSALGRKRTLADGLLTATSGQATAAQLPQTARILAAADAYQALTEPRPYRAAWSVDAAGAELRREANAGRLDADAVTAVLSAAGHAERPLRRTHPAGLTAREV